MGELILQPHLLALLFLDLLPLLAFARTVF
jgi:hypothetical protein